MADGDQTLLAHRGSYKTTDLSLFLAIHIVIQPNENVMFFRKTDDDVTEVVTQAKKILQSGVMQRIVSDLYGTDLQLLKSNNSEIHTNLCTSTKGVSQVVGLGIGTSITGKHADIVVTDDIVNLKDRISPGLRGSGQRYSTWSSRTSATVAEGSSTPGHPGTKRMQSPLCRM